MNSLTHIDLVHQKVTRLCFFLQVQIDIFNFVGY